MPKLIGTGRFISANDIEKGYLIDFRYENDRKYALVLNPNWEGKLHALKLEKFDDDSLRNILEEIVKIDDVELLYETFKNSQYVEARGYRTYIISKMSTIRRVLLKEETD